MRHGIFFFCVLIVSFFQHISGVVILVHGSFAFNASWCAPGGEFYDELERQALLQGEQVVPFLWSGDLGNFARLRAAKSLAKLVLSYRFSQNVILVGHSHGGNVIMLASQVLCSVLQETCQPLQAPLPYPISAVYLLATPVDTRLYTPCMNMIERLYNLYSQGDGVQIVLGFYEQQVNQYARVDNIRILFKDQHTQTLYNPNHCQMHDTLLATWLLKLSSFLSSEGKSGQVELCIDSGGLFLL